MKQSYYLRTEKVYLDSDIVRRYSFKTVGTRDSYALLAREHHSLAMNFAILGERSAHFSIKDCFECLSPHETAA